MGLNLCDQVQIPGVPAGARLAAKADLPAGLDASRNLHLEALIPHLDQSSRAVESFLEREVHLHLDVLAAARASVTGHGLGRLPGSVTVRGGTRSRPRSTRLFRAPSREEVLERAARPVATAAGAGGGGRSGGIGRLSAAAEGAEEVREVLSAGAAKLVADVSALASAVTGERTALAEWVARQRVARRTEPASSRAPRSRYLLPVGSERVVLLALLGIAENLVGLVHFLEPGFRGLVAGILVRVKLAGQPPIRPLDLVRGGCPGHSYGFVVVLVFHGSPLGRRSPRWLP